jgi:hypothetical protein
MPTLVKLIISLEFMKQLAGDAKFIIQSYAIPLPSFSIEKVTLLLVFDGGAL